MMKIKPHIQALLLAGLLIGSCTVYADDDLDVTMHMVPPGVELPDAVTNTIPLPSQAPGNGNPTALIHSQQGLDTANAARQGAELPQISLPPQVTLPAPAQGKGRH